MKIFGSSPAGLLGRSLRRGLVLSAANLLLMGAAFANGTTKPAESSARPVARLVSTSREEVAARTQRPRMIPSTRLLPASASAARVRPVVAAVAATGDERRAFDLINAERRERGQKPLVWDGELTSMARFHSENMARQNFFDHVDRDGLNISGRANAFGVSGWRALGENIAYNQGYEDPVSFAVERWMVSNKHRDNILNAQFTHAGIGIARASDGRVFFTQVFMTR